MKLEFTVPGKPQAQQRPFFSTAGGHVRALERRESRNAKAVIQFWAIKAMREQGWDITHQDVRVTLDSYFAVPKSFSKKKTEAALSGKIRPGHKGDVDNLFKNATDALNAVVYQDDCQIVEGVSRKFYGVQDCQHFVIEVVGDENKGHTS